MFNFFKRKGGKAEPGTPEAGRKHPSDGRPMSVEPRAPRNDNDVTNEKSGTLRKDVINLLLPETDYTQKNTGVSALFNIMGKRKRNRRKGRQQRETAAPVEESVRAPPTPAENIQAAEPPSDPADCIKALVLQKYAKPAEHKQQHVSLVYVSDEPRDEPRDERKHAEALLREIARTIDCEIDGIHASPMGADSSKRQGKNEPIYESVEDEFRDGVRRELDQIKRDEMTEEPKKSNLKPPRSDNEGCSDDDRSDNGKKRVTFRKRIVFDDGEEQTDDGDDSSFESLTSEEAEYLDEGPDNDELLGGFVVNNATIINVDEPIIKVECVDDLRRITSDSSDSGFTECERNESGDETSDVKSMVESDSEDEVEIEEVEEVEEIEEIEEESGSEVTDDENDDL